MLLVTIVPSLKWPNVSKCTVAMATIASSYSSLLAFMNVVFVLFSFLFPLFGRYLLFTFIYVKSILIINTMYRDRAYVDFHRFRVFVFGSSILDVQCTHSIHCSCTQYTLFIYKHTLTARFGSVDFGLVRFKIVLFRQENNKTHASEQDKCSSVAINKRFFRLERFVPFCLCMSVRVCLFVRPSVRLSIRLPIYLFVAPSAVVFIRLLFTIHFYCSYELCAGLIRLEGNLSRSHIFDINFHGYDCFYISRGSAWRKQRVAQKIYLNHSTC